MKANVYSPLDPKWQKSMNVRFKTYPNEWLEKIADMEIKAIEQALKIAKIKSCDFALNIDEELKLQKELGKLEIESKEFNDSLNYNIINHKELFDEKYKSEQIKKRVKETELYCKMIALITNENTITK